MKELDQQQYCITEKGRQVPILSIKDKILMIATYGLLNILENKSNVRVENIKRDLLDIFKMIRIEFEVKLGLVKGEIVPESNPRVRDLTLKEMKIDSG